MAFGLFPKNETCCPGFAGLLDNAGNNGLAALVEERNGRLSFTLQSRGLAHRHLEAVRAQGPDSNAPNVCWNISTSMILKYCPICGCRLERLIRRSPAKFHALFKQHEQFCDFKL